MAFVEFKNVYKKYNEGKSSEIVANRDVSFKIEHGEFCVIVGPSGAGKSTILNILGGMDDATSGEIYIDGKDICKFNKRQLNDYRRYDVGFVFQFYNLIPDLTVTENIQVGSFIHNDPMDIEKLIKDLGLWEHKNKYPRQLSGGQQQRCAIGRALIKKPEILLCDEPTGALDYKTSKDILSLLQKINKKYETTIIIATHNEEITKMANIIIRLKDGIIYQNIENVEVIDAQELEW